MLPVINGSLVDELLDALADQLSAAPELIEEVLAADCKFYAQYQAQGLDVHRIRISREQITRNYPDPWSVEPEKAK